MSDCIEFLDEVSPVAIKSNGWLFDRTYKGYLENTMPSYEAAFIYAEEQQTHQNVAIRPIVNGRNVYWEVYVKPIS